MWNVCYWPFWIFVHRVWHYRNNDQVLVVAMYAGHYGTHAVRIYKGHIYNSWITRLESSAERLLVRLYC